MKDFKALTEIVAVCFLGSLIGVYLGWQLGRFIDYLQRKKEEKKINDFLDFERVSQKHIEAHIRLAKRALRDAPIDERIKEREKENEPN